MDIYEAAQRLKDMVREGEAKRRKATMVHLFGIMYAEELHHLNIREVVELADLGYTWATEIQKGINLAEYVMPKTTGGR